MAVRHGRRFRRRSGPGFGSGSRSRPSGRSWPRRRARAAVDGRRLLGPLAVAGLVLAVFLALAVLSRGSAKGAAGPVAVGCDTAGQAAVHYHAHLDLFYEGRRVPVPAHVGMTAKCVYWLHTEQPTGILHIAAPASARTRLFTMGDFFTIWGEPLSAAQVAGMYAGPGRQVKVWQDGRPYSGVLPGLVLRPHTQVVIEVGPPFVSPPAYDWRSPTARRENAG
ncbi:MAG TPA: hypothetical protein VIK45_17150 [Candidatus Dormibacteraeota bacterium]